ncbi:anti-sigma factor domain-containing protein [Synoicihabitans lomoniglobus]|uniref:Anti-sigma factor n=1 Tax=Synoicihabitans lomoniglobus TaxID=2909285 RepID=A0AAE9ZSE6_9BACT|nr:anti-sigma factor [Opitutaceae bacterium LMO-M01]WED64380.1 anti-sigma factor [Opitutaceae bacterium LMO-M01]
MNSKFEEQATLYVLDGLDPGEHAAFEAQLLQSPELAALVRELESALDREIRLLPQHPPAADLLTRIESRLDRPDDPTPVGESARSSIWIAFARWSIAAVIAVSTAILAVQSLRRSDATTEPNMVLIVGLNAEGSTLTRMPMPVASNDEGGGFIQLASFAENLWNNPTILPDASTVANAANGYALFDPASNQGFIAIRNLPEPAPGQLYHMWIIDTASGHVVQAGVLPATQATSGLYSFAVAASGNTPPPQLNFFVTSESASSSRFTAPSGKVVLGSKRI